MVPRDEQDTMRGYLLMSMCSADAAVSGNGGSFQMQAGVIIGMGSPGKVYNNVSSADACCNLCGAEANCKAWTYHVNGTEKGRCFSHTDDSNTRNEPTVVSGRVSNGESCQLISHAYFGKDHNIGAIPNVSSAIECCVHCRTHSSPITSACVAWNWHTTDHTCWLHDSSEGFTIDKNSIGGVAHGSLPPTPAPTPAPWQCLHRRLAATPARGGGGCSTGWWLASHLLLGYEAINQSLKSATCSRCNWTSVYWPPCLRTAYSSRWSPSSTGSRTRSKTITTLPAPTLT